MDETFQNDQDITPDVDETTVPNETADASQETINTLSAQKAHWREKALKETEARKKLEDQLSRVKPQTQADGRLDSVVEDLTDLKLGQRGLDEDSARFVKTYAKGLGKTALEVLEDQTIKDFLESRKARQAHENAVPDPSSRTITVGSKPLSEMTDKEMKANWSSVVKAASRR